jgi:serine/threonine-protein kinase
MTAAFDRLATALSDRYRIERELGQGGMATVYLAEDLKHHRQVALKVLHPQIAAVLGADRFLREIETAATLNHPHILPLFDSGEAGQRGSGGELLWYTMPLVEGESLRDLLNRERQLSMDRALGITWNVASALAHAHARGIVHRDIKPENILLTGEHALVADFGIAKAISAAGGEKLTETGLAIGTAPYMSPEQASGERDLDGRSDIYALGCVLYEMLAGQPPFSGPTAQSILARHAIDPVPSLHTVRPEMPVAVEQAVKRALAKVPADRFATAKQFADALTNPSETVPIARVPRPSVRVTRIGGILAMLAMIVIAILVWSRRASVPPLDPRLIAVFPFRVSGTDQSFAAQREGMVDLLDVTFSGADGGPRVIPARTALAAWHRMAGSREDLTEDEAREVARRLGAGSLVLGTIVATQGRLVIQGSLIETGSGRMLAEAKVDGLPDSLTLLVDQLAVQLVALRAGERRERLASLTTSSLPALYAYLAGKAAHRAGQFDTALRYFERALDLDSTFALAALGYRASVGWAGTGNFFETRILRLAWTYRDRLSQRDRVLLNALAGPRYPERAHPRERIQAWESAVRQVPDDPDVWYNLGDAIFHDGAVAEVEEPFRRAAEAFNKALALDSTLNVEPMIHLLQIAGMERDTAMVRRLINRFPNDAPRIALRRLQAGAILDDRAMLAAARAAFDSTDDTGDLVRLLGDAQVFGIAIPEAERSAALVLTRLRPGSARLGQVLSAYRLYHQLGRPAAAAAALAHLGPEEATSIQAMQHIILAGLYRYGDTTAAAEAVARLAPSADGPLARDPAAQEEQHEQICLVEWWRLVHRDTRTAPAAIARLAGGKAHGCGVLLEALLAAVTRRPDAGAAFGRLDTLLRAGGDRGFWVLEIARWREAQGDVRGAFRAIRRRGFQLSVPHAYWLLEEGRLATLVGDRERAIKAYSHYLALRNQPEPSVKPEVDRVRAELAQLVGEPRP